MNGRSATPAVSSVLLRIMTVANLCGMVVGASFPKPVSDAEVMAEYETRSEKNDRRVAAAAAAAAAAVAAAASEDEDDEPDSDDDDDL